jgi:hypothetical protein
MGIRSHENPQKFNRTDAETASLDEDPHWHDGRADPVSCVSLLRSLSSKSCRHSELQFRLSDLEVITSDLRDTLESRI